jgi:AraC-like DNA-binding protein/signal transduction histidine kinase
MDLVFLSPNIHHGSAAQLWQGMTTQLNKDRLFIIAGGRIGAIRGAEALHNQLYGLVSPGNFQAGISWISALSGILSDQGVRKFHEPMNGIPWVAIGADLPGAPSITIDAYSGMVQLLSHMTEVHGCRRFAFIRGPENHGSAEDRYRAFVDFIRNRRLVWEEQRVLGPSDWTAGADVIRQALDEEALVPGRDFQALIGSSDLQSHEAAVLLRERGFEYPGDFLLCGFNNSPESRIGSPGLTTVHMPFEMIGAQALDLARNGGGSSRCISPGLIVRESCGCSTQAMTQAVAPDGWRNRKMAAALQNFEHALWHFSSLEDLSRILQEHLQEMGIDSAFVVKMADKTGAQAWTLLAGFLPGVMITGKQDFQAGLLLPPPLFSKLQEGKAWFILSLADKEAAHGHLLVQCGPETADLYEQIRISLTGALRNYSLLEQLRQARDQARKAEEVKSRFLIHAGAELQNPVRELLQLSMAFPEAVMPQFRKRLAVLHQLTEDLGDFSRSQVEDLAINPSVVDLRSLLGALYPGGHQLSPVPLVHVDACRLTQVLGGLSRLAGEVNQKPARVELCCQRQGLHLSLYFNQKGDIPTPLGESISQILYRHILMLHGGRLVIGDEDGKISAHLELPFPSFRGSIPVSCSGSIFLALTDGRSSQDGELSPCQDLVRQLGGELLVPSPEELFSILPSRLDGVFFDPDTADPRLWRSLMQLRNHPACAEAALLVFPGKNLPRSKESGTLWESLALQKGAIGAGPTVCIRTGDLHPEDLFPASEVDSLIIDRPADLSLIDPAQVPRVIIYLGIPGIPHDQLRSRKAWESVPIMIVARDFQSFGLVEDYLRDRIVFLHYGILSPEEYRRQLEGLHETGRLFSCQRTFMIQRAILYIDKHCSHTLTRGQIAKAVNASDDYFTRVFRREIGLSPWEYLTRLRMIRARSLLRSTGQPIQEVARRIGYDDQAYFCRVFRKTTGTSPSAYRRQGGST